MNKSEQIWSTVFMSTECLRFHLKQTFQGGLVVLTRDSEYHIGKKKKQNIFLDSGYLAKLFSIWEKQKHLRVAGQLI